MTPSLDDIAAALINSGFEIALPRPAHIRALAFENDTVLGFAIAYDSVAELLASWRCNLNEVTRERQFQLRAAGTKAWNVYIALLAGDGASFADAVALSSIEEDLGGTRKIARAGVATPDDIRAALLSLLPFRVAPVLDPIDMRAEIKARTTELDQRLVEAFLALAEESVVLQMLEEQP